MKVKIVRGNTPNKAPDQWRRIQKSNRKFSNRTAASLSSPNKDKTPVGDNGIAIDIHF